MERCPNHPGERVLATVKRGAALLCPPCAAKERVLALNIAALPVRTVDAVRLVREVRP